MARDTEHALSFGRNVGDYDSGRPSYPPAAIDWMLTETGRVHPVSRVVDVGAGTGKFTAGLLGRGLQLTAVEPDAAMRQRLAENSPSVTVLAGAGERLPLPDASADLVTFAQAWHWVDVSATSGEVARVLTSGGALALVWNIRDEAVGWVRRLGEVMGSSAAELYDSVTPPVGAPLERQAHAQFEWVNDMTRPQLLAMVASRSYVITMAEADRAAMFERLGELLDTHPQLAGRTSYPVPYLTRVTIARVV